MTAYDLGPTPRRGPAAPGPSLTTRPAAGAFIAMMFGLTVLVFLLGLLALSV
ncbi:hypothetical protein [Pseudonocardia humida]|uniref:Uncharacterized protein n=1 Tax=Pseudonocardia humida TaxID=2800819 RepID=A0ABT1AEB3_9PSEU|nr:hypothetical protein [Pseudonocardia humida]MCO1661184.1 hypothetical protein [Pseudonocardia humida]